MNSTDIIWHPALLNSNTAANNGGGMNRAAVIANDTKNNLLPNVSQTERTNGVTRNRKAFVHVAPTVNTDLLNVKVFIDKVTPGDDYVLLKTGTFVDKESDAAMSRPYGIAILNTAASASDTTVVVRCENAAGYTSLTPFRSGDTVRIANRDVMGSDGNEEYKVIDTVTYGQNTTSIALTTALAHSYPTETTCVSSVYMIDTITPLNTTPVTTSSAGVFANTLGLSHAGTPNAAWTLTFTTTTAYTLNAIIDGVSSNWTGNTSATLTATATVGGATKTLLSLPSSLFSGTWAQGDTVTFSTTPAAIPLWVTQIVPAATGSLSNDYCSIAVLGETA